jgi:signal transduction histidine kinase
MQDSQIRLFAQTIMPPLTWEDLIRVLPDAFQRLLRARAWCSANPDEPDARLCLPLWVDGQLQCVLSFGWPQHEFIDAGQEALLAEGACLAELALANRLASDAERERARAEAADVRFDLIGMLAHEMRTPLASIKGYSSAMLLDEIDLNSEMTVEFLQAIDEESDRLNEMVTHLLDSTVIEAGALELHREPVLLAGVIRRTVETMARRTDRHRLIVSCSSDMPPVYADEQRLKQVLTNLLDNAIKYSPDGGLIIVRCDYDGLRGEAVVAVSDQGIGIAPEHLNKLFERFFRTEQRRTHGIEGTGLGLPIVDSIVRAHGGRIWAESIVDEGTTLTFTLPVYQDVSTVDMADDQYA